MDRTRPAVLSGFAVALLLLLATPVSALNLYVDRLDDEYNGCSLDSCSLREAIQVVNNNSAYDTIYLPEGTIELSRIGAGEDNNATGDLDIRTSVTIVGKGPGVSIVDANFLDRVFHIMDPGVAVLFKRITITRGGNPAMGASGGGVYVNQGTAVFLHCDIVGNVSEVGGGASGFGGGLSARIGATLWIEESSVRWNSADTRGGGIFSNDNQIFILRSTISQNFAGAGGAAVWGVSGYITDSTISGNFGPTSEGGSIHVSDQLTLEFCTLTENSDPTITLNSSSTVVTLGRNIIHGQCESLGSAGPPISLGGNIETPGATCGLSPANDLVTPFDPELGPLGFYSGTTETHRPSPGSLVVDRTFPPGVPDCTRTDQRGFPRPQNASGGGSPQCDAGAVEVIYGEIFLDGFDCGYTGAWSAEAP